MTARVKALRVDRDARGVTVLAAAVRESAKVAAVAETAPVAGAVRERAADVPVGAREPAVEKDGGAVASRAETARAAGKVAAAAARIRALAIRRSRSSWWVVGGRA